jgi:hypothetical protein
MSDSYERYLDSFWRIQQIAFDAGDDAALREALALAESTLEAAAEDLPCPHLDGPIATWQAILIFSLVDSAMPRDFEWRGTSLPNLRRAELGLANLSWAHAPRCDWPALTHLTLAPNEVDQAGLVSWCAAQAWPELAHFEVKRVSGDSLAPLANARWLATLRSVVSTNTSLGIVLPLLVPMLEGVTKLHLNDAGVDDLSLSALARCPSRILDLDLSRNPLLPDSLISVLAEPPLRHLESLTVRGLSFDEAEVARRFCSMLPDSLRSLTVTHTKALIQVAEELRTQRPELRVTC